MYPSIYTSAREQQLSLWGIHFQFRSHWFHHSSTSSTNCNSHNYSSAHSFSICSLKPSGQPCSSNHHTFHLGATHPARFVYRNSLPFRSLQWLTL